MRREREYGLNQSGPAGIPCPGVIAYSCHLIAGGDWEMKRAMKKFLAGAGAASMVFAGSVAHAAQPQPWEMTFQPAATAIMSQITWFERYTLWFIVPVTLFVLFLLGWCILKFRASVNPVPSKTSHNTAIEVAWTLGPVLILLAIAIPSFQLLTAQYTPPEEPKLTVKATGNQWNWDYEYQIDKPLSFNSAILADADRAGLGKEDKTKYPRLLAVDHELVVPVGVVVRVLVVGSDVIHSYAVPAFGIKVDAVPGRANETWFKAEKEGLYYGQCSELCGKDHAFMPIAVRVVSEQQYETWLAAARTDLPGANKALMAQVDGTNKVASAGN
ncbi:cytochrome c oxidase subunit II [Mesorhizobium hungaricum]|uniref:Cytochrome c oxidase subunit 2 n=2 Tax=Hyphomicrobiales TaxID=356 RepID=A0A1C2DK96_9HYPH|nr:cytochrome c oxidase subunit II [Mesorhizobium hungaricum]